MASDNGEFDTTPTESTTSGTVGNFSHGNRETLSTSTSISGVDRSEKAQGHKSDMDVGRESDRFIVPEKPGNNGSVPLPAETAEGRGLTKENIEQTLWCGTQGPESGGKPLHRRSRGLFGVHEAAQRDKKMRFTNLFHHLTPELLRSSFFDLKKDAAPGVDGTTWRDYAAELEVRLEELHGRLHRGAYRAQPSRRMYIQKLDGSPRPLGIAALEDKIVQQAVCTILNGIYENDFQGFSYGFRPGRAPYQALDALYVGICEHKVNWILDADIRSFFDKISHEKLMMFLEHRIADPRLLRLLRKWLTAGVSEDGKWSATTVGTPQGAVISPLYANIFLHYVLDLWIGQWRERHARGEVIIVRYADDFVIGFQHEKDARRCLAELRDRMTKFHLELHPDKTRLIAFGRYAAERRAERGEGPPETFDFLGFTHISGKNRQGRFEVHRRTARKKFQAKLATLKAELRRRRHGILREVGVWLRSVITGWYQYYAVPGNMPRLNQFRTELQKMWLSALRTRSQKGGRLTWEQFKRRCDKWLPSPKILHPYPNVRFRVKHPR